MPRKIFLVLLFALIVAVAGYLIYGTAQRLGRSDAAAFRIATDYWVGFAPLYLARERGYFAAEGVEVELVQVQQVAELKSALSSSHIEAHTTTLDTMTLWRGQGVPTRAVLMLDRSDGGDGILVDESITRASELRSREIAVQRGTPSHFFLLHVLAGAGLKPDQFTLVDLPSSEAGAAFVAGRIDAAVTWEPWLSRASQRSGSRVLVTTADLPEVLVDVLGVRSDVLESRTEETKAVIRGWLRAVEDWRSSPEDANRVMAKVFSISPEEFAEMVTGLNYAGPSENQTFFSVAGETGSPADRLVEQAAALYLDAGLSSRTPLPEEVLVPDLTLSIVANLLSGVAPPPPPEQERPHGEERE